MITSTVFQKRITLDDIRHQPRLGDSGAVSELDADCLFQALAFKTALDRGDCESAEQALAQPFVHGEWKPMESTHEPWYRIYCESDLAALVVRADVSPLHAASASGNADWVRRRLALGDDVGAHDELDRTALHYGAATGGAEVLQLLVRAGADADARDMYGETPLHFAAITGRADTVRELLCCGADVDAMTREQATPLILTCRNGRVDVARTLLDSGADPIAADAESNSPLHWLFGWPEPSEDNDWPGEDAVLELIDMLCDAGADPNAKGADGNTPLHGAVGDNALSAEPALALLRRGADPNVKADFGDAPIHIAIRTRYVSVAREMLDVGVDADLFDHRGRSLVEFARLFGTPEHVQILRDHFSTSRAM